MKNLLYTVVGCLLCLWALPVSGHSDCLFTHYSSEDGLSQNTIMSVLQDKKGNMWFSTWDGINKFDGYSFKTYKARPNNRIALTNNRVDYMYEDEYGFIWLLTYDNQVFRFDPRTEVFERVPATAETGADCDVRAVKLLQGGIVWLLADKGGAVRVSTDATTCRLSCEWYRELSKHFPAVRMNDVYRDSSGHEWLLTDNGLGLLSADGKEPVFYFRGRHRRKPRRSNRSTSVARRARNFFSVRTTVVYGDIRRGTDSSVCCSFPFLRGLCPFTVWEGMSCCLLLPQTVSLYAIRLPEQGNITRLPDYRRHLSCRPIVTRREKSGSNRKSREL